MIQKDIWMSFKGPLLSLENPFENPVKFSVCQKIERARDAFESPNCYYFDSICSIYKDT